MAQRKRIKLEKLLTEVELEIMNVVWGLGECTVKEVQDALPKDRTPIGSRGHFSPHYFFTQIPDFLRRDFRTKKKLKKGKFGGKHEY